MKALALADGDLVVGSTGHATISGANKVRQDLAYAIGEVYGSDRFHPEWGSTISNMVGIVIDRTTAQDVRTEISRVMAQYISVQGNEILSDVVNGLRTRYQTADVIRSVESIDAKVYFDAIRIQVSLTTRAKETIRVNRTVSI